MENTHHPLYPQSNVAKFSGYEPDKYAIDEVSLTVKTDECLTPGRPPTLTQNTIGKYLQPLTRALVEVPPRPTIDELPDAVIDRMVQMDKAFWVDKPGANAYTLHDAYYNYGMTTEKVLPAHQDVFPRSYQFDLDCVKYWRLHACDNFKPTAEATKVIVPLQFISNLNHKYGLSLRGCMRWFISGYAMTKDKNPLCRDCRHVKMSDLVASNATYEQDSGQKRWRQYPDVKATLSPEQIREMMKEVGRPFQNEACNWYYSNYPPVKYNCIMRKFSK